MEYFDILDVFDANETDNRTISIFHGLVFTGSGVSDKPAGFFPLVCILAIKIGYFIITFVPLVP
jgi:hypothetical protein